MRCQLKDCLCPLYLKKKKTKNVKAFKYNFKKVLTHWKPNKSNQVNNEFYTLTAAS